MYLKAFQKKIWLLTSFLVMSTITFAQSSSISGRVSTGNEPVSFANIFLKETQLGAYSDENGNFTIDNIPEGSYTIQASAVGLVTQSTSIDIKEKQNIHLDFKLAEDILNISQVVVTGSRNHVERYNSPVIVNRISAEKFEVAQALNIAEGLNFAPGLRVENKCQNCGFTQLRMNGLDGAYSQILINSRPVFSALAGVYGLEMLPTNMVDRIEVVRGGGSVMYGGNAIAGTVNIITKAPISNTFGASINQSFLNGETSDRTVNVNGSIVSEDLNKGFSFFGFNRNRGHWDASGDDFSEIVQLRNNTFGFDAFYHINDYHTIKLGAYYIDEFRRGGNKFDLFPHQTDVTEQLEHDIVSANFSYDFRSQNEKHSLLTYGSLQHVNRSSYYGGGGRVIAEGDTLTPEDVLALNAYGFSTDLSAVCGAQYNYDINPVFSMTLGSEYTLNDVLDEMPGYQRLIDQHISTWGNFAELQIKPIKKLTFLFGGRFDQLSIEGKYDLAEKPFSNNQTINVFIPRVSAMYAVHDNIKLRASFAQGYRGPQAFDEDLHIETVGGSARFVQLQADLNVERSNSAMISLNYDKFTGKNQMNFVIEGFYTKLNNPFIFANQTELPSGVAVVTKRNGDGATVSGVNLEANIAFGSKVVVQSGATFQVALYDKEEELWSPEIPSETTPVTATKGLLRTPNSYGYCSLVYSPVKALQISYSGVITGSMQIPHVIDVETERTVLETTPVFFENNIKTAYSFKLKDRFQIELFSGVQNIFNAYQNDFDEGANRDAGYVYGPIRPRTYFMGMKFGLN